MRGFAIEELDSLFNSRIPTRKFASYSFATMKAEAAYDSTEIVQEGADKDDVKATVVVIHKAVKKAL